MNKIEQIIIDMLEGQITFLATFDSPILTDQVTLYIDEACNNNNIHLDDPEKHNYVLTSTDSNITVTATENNQYQVVVNDISIRDYSEHLKYVRMIAANATENEAENIDYLIAEGLFYNALIIYEAEIYNINKYCSTCLDDKNMQLIVYATFRRQLLEDAILLNHYKEAMQLYLDLCRVLGIVCDFKLRKCEAVKGSCSSTICSTCSNGTCSIC